MKIGLEKAISAAISPGFAQALKGLRAELGLAYRHHRGVKRAARYSGRHGCKINFGSGLAAKPGWINVDLNKAADLALDLRRPLPFDSASCAMVYSEHFLEHLQYPGEALQFLQECARILEPEGVLSLGVPDTEWYMLDYCGVANPSRTRAGFAEEDVFAIAKRLWHPKWCQTRMEHLHHHTRQAGEHQFAYDFETLEKLLHEAGFTAVERRDFDPALDSKQRALNTLYVNARH
ncbi:putative SAM-dependent methyltransferase [Rhizomicrobium palustre]|uniref:Putative SAM-dependent methyltransferase n=1 Tax=Rhizomicrobium palustre TaxID=189966 RepID=A0A846MW17_9PROT|nr:methyltransferase domain-containing protein [Rhizomicrobium palustre]NIK87187.1 putative SAM-dependent methyltransferase [Rhizomicrobium palustre]